MSDAPTDAAAAADADAAATVASAVAAAPFVHIFAHADGDSVAACGLLAVALREHAVPFRIHISADPAGDSAAADNEPDAAASRTLVVGGDSAGLSIPSRGQPASVTAATISRELGIDPDPVLALAGVVASGETPGGAGSEQLLDRAEREGRIARRPGVGLPTTEFADLAYTTRLDAPFTGDTQAVRELVDAVAADDSEETHRRLASTVAVETATADSAAAVAANSVGACLRPYATPKGPFATLGGYADVLSALACRSPGAAVAVTVDPASTIEEALDCWRAHGDATHAALTDPISGRYDGVYVSRVSTDQPSVLPAVARLTRQYRSPEPVALVVTSEPIAGSHHAAVAAGEPQGLAAAMATVADEFAGESGGTTTAATLKVTDVGTDRLIAACREVIT